MSVRFEYDAFNRRAGRQDGSAWVEYVHDAEGHLLAELKRPATPAGAWSTVREYVWLEGQPLAQQEYPGPAGRTDGYTYYYHLDHLGQPRALTGESGAKVWTASPGRPYGNVVETTAVDPLNSRTVSTRLRLPGQYDEKLLTSVGLPGPYYNWNRWYLPSMGRYMELDPIAAGGGFNGPFEPNWYGYAEGNPLRWVDPQGLYNCSYSISSHRMMCVPSDPENPVYSSDKYVAGQNTVQHPDCQNNPACTIIKDTGPLPLGDYRIGNRRVRNGHMRDLYRNGGNVFGRDKFLTHGCSDPKDCSQGCIAATTNRNRDLFDDLMDLEPENWITVQP